MASLEEIFYRRNRLVCRAECNEVHLRLQTSSSLIFDCIQVAIRTYMYDTGLMNGHEFVKRVKRLGHQTGKEVRYESHGKGSHGRLYYGERFTTLKDRKKEIGKGLLKAMCTQLGIQPDQL